MFSVKIKQNRNYGIDMLRIIAMFMVVILHVLDQGGILQKNSISSSTFWAAWFLETAAYGAVDIFALISGYVCYKTKYHYSNIAELWLRVFLYSVSFTLIDKIFFDHSIGIKEIVFSFFPVTTRKLWYFTMYFGLYLLIPLLNIAIEKLDKNSFRNITISTVFLFSIPLFVWDLDTFSLHGGYTLIWLMVLYLLGAYIGKYNIFSHLKKRYCLIGYFLCITVPWCAKYVFSNFIISIAGHKTIPNWLINYTSLPILFSAVFLLLLFRNINCPLIIKKCIAVVSPLAFSVYIIHILIPNRVALFSLFSKYASFSPFIMILSVLGTSAAVFIVCIVIDYIRAKIFNLLKIKERLNHIEQNYNIWQNKKIKQE